MPSKHPANQVLDDYYDEEKLKRRDGSAESDVLDEVIAGLKEYFGKCLSRILLYRFEREQYAEKRRLWEQATTEEWEGKGPGDVYGAEHLTRLIGKWLPCLIKVPVLNCPITANHVFSSAHFLDSLGLQQ